LESGRKSIEADAKLRLPISGDREALAEAEFGKTELALQYKVEGSCDALGILEKSERIAERSVQYQAEGSCDALGRLHAKAVWANPLIPGNELQAGIGNHCRAQAAVKAVWEVQIGDDGDGDYTEEAGGWYEEAKWTDYDQGDHGTVLENEAEKRQDYDQGDMQAEASECSGSDTTLPGGPSTTRATTSESLSSQLAKAQAHLARVSAAEAEAHKEERMEMLEQKLAELRRHGCSEGEGDYGDDARVRTASYG